MLLMLHVDKTHSHDGSQMLTDNSIPPIDWCTRDTGESSDHVIVIIDCERLVKSLLPIFHFPSTSPASFIRKLFRWGFRQVSETYQVANKSQPDRLRTSYMYECQAFRKGNFPLLQQMSSHTAAGARRKVISQHQSTELAHRLAGAHTQATSQLSSNPAEPTDRATEVSLPRATGLSGNSPALSPPASLANLDQNPRLYTNQRQIRMQCSRPAALATVHELRSNPSIHGMTLSPGPTSTIALQYSLTLNELARIEQEQMMLQLANEQIRLHQLRRATGDVAAPFGHAIARGVVRGNSPPFRTGPVSLVRSPPASTEFPMLLHQSGLNSNRPSFMATGIQGVPQAPVHTLPIPTGFHNGGSQSPFLPSLQVAPQRSPSLQPAVPLPSNIPRPVDPSDPMGRTDVARIQTQPQSLDPLLEQQYKLAALQQQGVSVEQLFLMQQRQQQQLSREISSMKSQLALSPSFGQTGSSVKQPATTEAEGLGESPEKASDSSCFEAIKDDHGTE
jgi:HSF-type DNA-binding